MRLYFILLGCWAFLAPKLATAQTPTFKTQIALVRAGEFYNETNGISRLVKAQAALSEAIAEEEKNYNKQVGNLQALRQEIAQLERDANKQSDAAMKRSLVPQLERDVEERKFMLDEAYKLKESELVGPVIKAIIQELDAFRKQKGYTLVLNADNLNQAGTLLSFDDRIDITTMFIQHYNQKFPAK